MIYDIIQYKKHPNHITSMTLIEIFI